MSLDAIQAVSAAEQTAKRMKSEAEAEGRRAAAEAEAQGRAAVEEAVKQAAEELKRYKENAVKAADSVEREIRGNTARDMAALRAQAEARLDQAAERIVERIVG